MNKDAVFYSLMALVFIVGVCAGAFGNALWTPVEGDCEPAVEAPIKPSKFQESI